MWPAVSVFEPEAFEDREKEQISVRIPVRLIARVEEIAKEMTSKMRSEGRLAKDDVVSRNYAFARLVKAGIERYEEEQASAKS